MAPEKSYEPVSRSYPYFLAIFDALKGEKSQSDTSNDDSSAFSSSSGRRGKKSSPVSSSSSSMVTANDSRSSLEPSFASRNPMALCSGSV